jgi:agmatine deiminase
MLKKFITLTVFLVIIVCTLAKEENVSYPMRIPGEFETQNAIWLGFKTNDPREYAYDSIVTSQIIKELNPFIQINLVIENDSLLPNGIAYFDSFGLDTNKIKLFFQSPTSSWYRDPGPIFGFTPENKLAIADFKYTNYQNIHHDSLSTKAIQQEGIDRDVANRLGLPIISSGVAMEGGGFETNGKGTLIQNIDFTLKRNPHLTQDEIEEDFRKNFGITNVIWLPTGIIEDPQSFKQISENYYGFGAGGHTDEFVRFANDSTILISWVEESEKDQHEIHALNYEILAKNYEILRKSRNTDGKTFNVIKVPHPEPEVKSLDGKKFVAATSYLNYVISNDIVLIPKYWEEGKSLKIKNKDQKVHTLFKILYPERKVVGINPLQLNWNGGGMHCRYQPEPKAK